MNTKLKVFNRQKVVAMGCVALTMLVGDFAGIAQAQSSAVSLPPGVQDVVKLTQAGISEDVILSQVRNAGAYYNLSADQIIYLTKNGVTQNVIKALIVPNGPVAPNSPVPPPPSANVPPPPPNGPAPTFAAPPTAPPPGAVVGPGGETPSFDAFHDQLAPYGTWIQVAGYGWCWRPNVAAYDVSWRPYGDGGHWVYTADGWYWESDYPWGGIVFHYGRWLHDSLGWLWVPGYDWAPAWVTWRLGDDAIGWAALPPGAIFRAGVGFEFRGRVGVDLDFGLGPDAFLFVGYDHFWDHNLHAFFWPHDRVDFAFRHSVIANGYRFDHGRFIVEGLGRERIGEFTHHEIRVEAPVFHDFHGRVVEDRRGFHDDRHFDDHRSDGHDRDRDRH